MTDHVMTPTIDAQLTEHFAALISEACNRIDHRTGTWNKFVIPFTAVADITGPRYAHLALIRADFFRDGETPTVWRRRPKNTPTPPNDLTLSLDTNEFDALRRTIDPLGLCDAFGGIL